MKKLRERLHFFFTHLKAFISRPWYGPLIAFLALLDNLIIIVPTDGMLISSSLLKPKRWFFFAVCIAIGSTMGAALFGYLVQTIGLPGILYYFPTIQETTTWHLTQSYFGQYGMVVVFLVAASPFFQQPSVILACVAGSPLWMTVSFVFAGRLFKFLFISYLASHAPRLLSKLWGIQDEMAEVGVESTDLKLKK